MRAAVFDAKAKRREGEFLEVRDVPQPEAGPGEVVVRVIACGVCRTDLHIVERDLPVLKEQVIPGHQIVGEVVEVGEGAKMEEGVKVGAKVGAFWLGGTDGECWFCTHGLENLCDKPVFTGYTMDGGYAEFARLRADFVTLLPEGMDGPEAAPLLCAGVIGFRSLRVAGVEKGERVGLYGFGSSASLCIEVLKAWGCRVYVSTRGEKHRERAKELGAIWVGKEDERPPVVLDRAITFAPSGDVVVGALGALRKGGVVAINAVHLDRMPEFDYDTMLWGERQIRSVANVTREDAREFLKVAKEVGIKPRIVTFGLEQANEALRAVKEETGDGSVVIVMETKDEKEEGKEKEREQPEEDAGGAGGDGSVGPGEGRPGDEGDRLGEAKDREGAGQKVEPSR